MDTWSDYDNFVSSNTFKQSRITPTLLSIERLYKCNSTTLIGNVRKFNLTHACSNQFLRLPTD